MPIPKKTKATDSDLLLQKIEQEFPSLGWSNFEYIDQGWDHEVIILDKQIVFRFPANPDYLKLLKREVNVLRLLRSLVSIKVPDYQFVAQDYSFAGYRYIPGESVYLETFNNLENASRSLIVEQLATFLSVIHTQDTSKYIRLGLPTAQMQDDQNHVKQVAKKQLYKLLSEADAEAVSRMLSNVDKLIGKKLAKVFLHGDIYSTHLLWDKTANKLGIIDFSDMNIGDPAFDFAELFEYGRDFVEAVYELYSGPKDDSFLDRAWIYQCWVSVFMMINYFETHKTSFEVARQTFDRVK